MQHFLYDRHRYTFLLQCILCMSHFHGDSGKSVHLIYQAL